jgi:TatD DNase family protein
MRNSLDHVRGFDFHCHVDLHPDPPRLVARCEEQRIVTLAVTTTPRAWAQNRQWFAKSQYVHAGAGLHPELVGDRYRELSQLEAIIAETHLIGEVGLDASPQHRGSFKRQTEVFDAVLTAAQKLGGRVLTIHSRRAASAVIDALVAHTSPTHVLPILHWFSGSTAEALRAVEHGCYFSVNNAMLEHARGRALVRKIPFERLLTETDSPFTRTGERSSLPWDVIATSERLAASLGRPNEHMRDILRENAMRVLMFAGLVER